ncbi:MAG: DUF5313 family protein [Acidothermaceae bacterium]
MPGDPGPWRWLCFAIGFRLAPPFREWVRHELTDAGWRVRALVRQLVILLPIAAIFFALPGQWIIRIGLAVLILFGGTFVTLAYGDSLRASRLRQHSLPVPEDRDLGRPTDAR